LLGEPMERLMKLRVRDVMSEEAVAVSEDTSVLDAAKVMAEKRIGCILVKRDNKVVGIVTERDLVRRVVAKGLDPEKVKVSEIMSTPVVAVKDSVSVEEAVMVMAKNGIRRLPVVDERNALVGIVTATDLAKALAVEYKMENALFNALARVRPPPPGIYG